MTIINTVLGALNGEPQPAAQIAEALGLEITQVSPALTTLRQRGDAIREKDGWIAGNGGTEKAAPRQKMQRKTAELSPPEPESGERTLEFALSETGAILLRDHDGAWDWIAMSAADVAALKRLLART